MFFVLNDWDDLNTIDAPIAALGGGAVYCLVVGDNLVTDGIVCVLDSQPFPLESRLLTDDFAFG
jgi:hypothetical protein